MSDPTHITVDLATQVINILPVANGPLATDDLPGFVQPDGSSITIDLLTGIISATGSTIAYADNEILAGSGTSWTFSHAPISNLPASTSVHLYALQYVGGPFVRLPPSAIVSIIGTAMVTAASWSAGALMADYRY